MDLTAQQKTQIRSSFFDTVKDDEERRTILSIAYAYADEQQTDGALEEMVWYLSQTENQDQIDTLSEQYLSGGLENTNSDGTTPGYLS